MSGESGVARLVRGPTLQKISEVVQPGEGRTDPGREVLEGPLDGGGLELEVDEAVPHRLGELSARLDHSLDVALGDHRL